MSQDQRRSPLGGIRSDLNPASVEAIVRKDFHDAIRSRGLILLTGVFIVFFVAAAYFFSDILGPQMQQQAAQQGRQVNITSDTFIRALTDVTTLLVPLIGLVIAYASVIGERESGTLKLLLALPHSRLDVVVGKVLGRGSVVAIPVAVGFAAGMLVFPFTPVSLAVGNYVLFAILTVLLGLVFVALAVGISAAASTNKQAVVGAVGLYVLFTLFWNALVNGLVRRLADQIDISNATFVHLHLGLKHLNPTQAYKSLATRLIVDNAAQARGSLISGFQRQFYTEILGGSVPVYLSDPAVLLYLLVWVIVPPALGYIVFDRADL